MLPLECTLKVPHLKAVENEETCVLPTSFYQEVFCNPILNPIFVFASKIHSQTKQNFMVVKELTLNYFTQLNFIPRNAITVSFVLIGSQNNKRAQKRKILRLRDIIDRQFHGNLHRVLCSLFFNEIWYSFNTMLKKCRIEYR